MNNLPLKVIDCQEHFESFGKIAKINASGNLENEADNKIHGNIAHKNCLIVFRRYAKYNKAIKSVLVADLLDRSNKRQV